MSKDEPGGGLDAYARFTKKLKEKNPSLKAIIAIGGWNEGSEKYSAMASGAATRETFADSVVKFLEKYSFDGLEKEKNIFVSTVLMCGQKSKNQNLQKYA